MAHPHYHAKSSARKFGGQTEDYERLHAWFDQTKAAYCEVTHRAVLHNATGIFLAEQMFGLEEENRRLRAEVERLRGYVPSQRPTVFTRESDGKEVAIRLIGEQHVREDCGFVPSIEDWLKKLPLERWMMAGARPLSKEFADPAA